MPVDHTKNSIEIRNVSFSYEEREVLRDINLDIHSGDYVGLIGPNGGGKTTLIKLMVGLLPLTKGTITFFPNDPHSEKPTIGYVAQNSTNFDTLFPIRVCDVVSMGRIAKRGILKRLTSEDHEIVHSALKHVGLEDQEKMLLGNLSGGQQQRVFIARALAKQPQIIVLDEPTAGIDAPSQEQFYTLLEKLNTTLGITLVLVSHDIDVVVNEVTEVACINHSLVYHGTPKEFVKENYLTSLYGKEMKFVVHGH